MTQLFDIYTMDDCMFGPVIGPNVMAAHLNMDMLEEAGLVYPEKTWTHDDWVTSAQAMAEGDGIDQTFGSTKSNWWMPFRVRATGTSTSSSESRYATRHSIPRLTS